jgi:hypothetical protein
MLEAFRMLTEKTGVFYFFELVPIRFTDIVGNFLGSWAPIPPSPPFLWNQWDRAFLNSNAKKSPELSISQPGDS